MIANIFTTYVYIVVGLLVFFVPVTVAGMFMYWRDQRRPDIYCPRCDSLLNERRAETVARGQCPFCHVRLYDYGPRIHA